VVSVCLSVRPFTFDFRRRNHAMNSKNGMLVAHKERKNPSARDFQGQRSRLLKNENLFLQKDDVVAVIFLHTLSVKNGDVATIL